MNIDTDHSSFTCYNCGHNTKLRIALLYNSKFIYICTICFSKGLHILEMNGHKQFTTTRQIFEEFCYNLEKQTFTKITCPSCCSNLYDNKKHIPQNRLIYAKKCYRCGILICSECQGVLASDVNHAKKHKLEFISKSEKLEKKDMTNIEESIEALENEIKKISDDTSYYFISVANCLRLLVFSKNELKGLNPKTQKYEELLEFIQMLGNNIKRIYNDKNKYEEHYELVKSTRKISKELDIHIELLTILTKGYLKKGSGDINDHSFVDLYYNNSRILCTASIEKELRQSPKKSGDVIEVVESPKPIPKRNSIRTMDDEEPSKKRQKFSDTDLTQIADAVVCLKETADRVALMLRNVQHLCK
jgi:hypothetical protein